MKQKQPLPQRNLQHQGRKPSTAAVVALFLHGILLVSSRELRPEILPSALKISDSEILNQSNQTQGRRYRDKRSFDGDKSENQSLLRRGKSPHPNKGSKTSRSSPTNISYNGERIEVSPISSNVHLYPEPKKTRKTTDDDTIIISAPVESSHYLPAGMEKSFSPSDTPRLNNPGDDQFEVLKTKTLLREESPDALLQQTRKACVLVQLSLKLDTNPEDTSWLITLGDRDVLESGDAIIVAESRGQYGSTGKETISICLPGNGQYTFTVFNWTGNGNGDYSLLSDGRTVFKGRKFGWIRTNTFVLPLPELPSDSPSQSSLPTTSPVPTMDCTFIDISITFDSSPDETSWLVFEGNYNTLESGDANIIQKSPDYDQNQYAYTTETYRVCLPNEGQFSFAIFDKFGNGICCGGGYTVTSPDSSDTIAQGGEFGSIELKTFFLPFGSTPITPPPQSAPPTSPAPTTTCFKIEISFLFDSFPSETKWSLSEIDSNPFITGGPFDDWSYAGVFTQQSLCLPEGVYEFIVSDLSGDGICCSYGDGTYSIIYTAEGANDIIAEGGSFGYSDNVIFSLPYEHKSPTVSPAPTSSLLPTSECYMVEVSLKFGQNPSESMWVVVEGDAGGIQNDDWIPVVVMESPSSYYDTLPSFTVDFQTFCLSEGEFTFFIVDDAGDGMGPEGSYTLALIQDDGSKTIIAQGGSFLTLESTTFVIPFVPQPLDVDSQPTPSPSSPSGRETLQPTPLASNLVPSTTAPSNTCIWMQVTLEFAVFPYYIRWYLFAGDFDDLESNKQNLIAQSPSYDGIERYATMVHDLCLPNENAIYSFAIFDDSNYDYGRGVAKYILSHGKAEETFAFGGEFNYFELVTFEVPFLPVPTSMPSISLQPSPPNAPPADCSIMLEIIIQPDGFPEEIRWEVAAGGSSSTEDPSAIIIAQSPPGEVSSETYKVCLPWEGLYTFTIFDSAGDGLCCTGSYELFLNGQTIGSGMTFGYIESTQFSFPYIRPPSPPTMTPTITQQPSISPKPSIKLDCIEITVNSDESVSWDIAIGSESSFTSNAELVATSPFYSGFNETETHLICLEDGKYTFTIYGGSAYTIIFKDDADTLIAEVYDIYGVESTTFNIPYFAPPTASPTISSQPSYSHNPTNECIQLDIELQFDTFPDESSWMVIAGSFNEDGSYDGDRLIAQSPFYDPTNYTDAKEQISFCLPGEGVYSFAMRDSSYDGMCCSFGNGGFVISTQGTTIAQGGQFQEYDIITFNIPFLPMPSLSPSTSTKPSYSLSPTEDCSRIVVSILFDAYPSEVLWNFVESNGEIGENIVAESPLYDNSKADSIVTETICLKDGLYVFTISDGAGDGICCGNFGEGKYEVLLLGGTNQTLAEGGDYGYFESTTFLLPYTVLPTSMPSVSPQPTNSISPTSSCVWIEVIINFDANPFDTLWDIAIGSYSSYDVDDAVSVADSPIYSMEAAFDTARHPVCLPGKGRYTFGIMKSGGFQGSGGYILVTVTDGGNRAVIAQGGGFEWTDSVTFDIPLYISPRF